MTAEVDFGEVNSSELIQPTFAGRDHSRRGWTQRGRLSIRCHIARIQESRWGGNISMRLEVCIGIFKGKGSLLW